MSLSGSRINLHPLTSKKGRRKDDVSFLPSKLFNNSNQEKPHIKVSLTFSRKECRNFCTCLRSLFSSERRILSAAKRAEIIYFNALFSFQTFTTAADFCTDLSRQKVSSSFSPRGVVAFLHTRKNKCQAGMTWQRRQRSQVLLILRAEGEIGRERKRQKRRQCQNTELERMNF